jgi:hypothetical protein
MVDCEPDMEMRDSTFLELKNPEVFDLRVRSPQTREESIQVVFALSPRGVQLLVCHPESGDQFGVRIGRRPSQTPLAPGGER